MEFLILDTRDCSIRQFATWEEYREWWQRLPAHYPERCHCRLYFREDIDPTLFDATEFPNNIPA